MENKLKEFAGMPLNFLTIKMMDDYDWLGFYPLIDFEGKEIIDVIDIESITPDMKIWGACDCLIYRH